MTTAVFNPAKSTDWTKEHDGRHGLTSPWSAYYGPSEPHGRIQGELDDLVVYGKIPEEISGTFYRLTVDPATTPHPKNPFIDGDGNLGAFRFDKGRVDFKMKYVETERYLLERKAGKRLFNIYRNPFSHHPCVRNANDSPANTNIVNWGGKLLAISERSLPYVLDPDSLETIGFDPFQGQTQAKTFTAHPKIDPFRNELVVWGYEAKGLGTPDVCFYSVDTQGKIMNETWFKEEYPGMVHDAWVTENWIVMSSMPFRVTSEEEMKAGSHHWEFVPERPSVFWVAPRRSGTPRHPGWKAGEVRKYKWDNGIIFHTGAAWEDEDGNLKLESHFVPFNFFYFFNPPGTTPPADPKADWVRWTIDLNQPSSTRLNDPDVLLPALCDFPKTDDRFYTRKQNIVFLIAMDAARKSVDGMLTHFNNIVKLNTETGEMLVYEPGEGGRVAEPVFVARSEHAPEGDGWIICWQDTPSNPRGELVVLDTNDFSKPLALVQMPFPSRTQVHGSWVDNPNPGQPAPRLTSPLKDVILSNNGPLQKIA